MKDYVELPPIALPILLALIFAALASAAAGYVLGPQLKTHRERLLDLHEQEKSQRNAFHLRIVQILEGV